jgi:TonB-dependent starch-binding outer membrane protein SusC
MKYKLSLNNLPYWRFLMMVIVSFYTSISIAQTQVKGNIKDVSGEPLIGVSIKEKGTSNGTVSDLDGNFAITTSKSNFLQVSYIGYISQEIKAENGKTLQIVLQENSEILEDVVVVGYGTQKKVNLTGSVSAVTAKELANKPVTSTAQALADTYCPKDQSCRGGCLRQRNIEHRFFYRRKRACLDSIFLL